MDTPTAEQVAEEVQSILAAHHQDQEHPNFCAQCGQRWPCDIAEAAFMLSALQAERESLARRNAELEADVARWKQNAAGIFAASTMLLAEDTPPPEKEE